MDKIHTYGLLLNLFLYIIITAPVYILSSLKKIYENKQKFIIILVFSILYFIVISLFLYNYPYKYFSLFTDVKGIINYGIYTFKILFACSSLYSIKILVPKFIIYQTQNKKITIFYIMKIAITIIFSIIGYILFNTKGILFAFPIIDFIYSIVYLYLFLRFLNKKI